MKLGAKILVLLSSLVALNGYADTTEHDQRLNGRLYVEADAQYGKSIEPAVKSSVSMVQLLEAGGGYTFEVGSTREFGVGIFGGKGNVVYNKRADDSDYLVYLDLNYLTTLKGHYTHKISDNLAATAQAGLGTLRGEYRSDRIGKKVKAGATGLTYTIDFGARFKLHPNVDLLGGVSLWMINAAYNDVTDKGLYLNCPAVKFGLQYSI